MLELIAVMIAAISMAKHGKRRYTGFFVARCRGTLALGTLADDVVVGAVLTDTLAESAFLISVKLVWTLSNLTPGEGPIEVGVAHSDYSDAEIEAWIENTGSWDPSTDKVAQEIARRKIRLVGSFAGITAEEVLNDGKPIKTTCKWQLTTGQSLKWWAYSRAGVTNLTTGSSLKIDGPAYLRRT